MSARDNILGRIRGALRGGAAPSQAALAEADRRIVERPRGPGPVRDWEPVARFRERVLALSSTVDEIASLADLPRAVAAYLKAGSLPEAGVCWPELAALDWAGQGLSMEARAPRGDDLVGITGAFCAVADTGTLMFLSGPATPATASLLPETHIAVLPVSRIVPLMEDGWALARSERGALPRTVNFVSGPSRTADIEQTVTLGAHGPYRVHIVLLTGA